MNRHIARLALPAAIALASLPALADGWTREQVDAALPKLEAHIDGLIAEGAVPGLAVAIVHADEVVYLKGFGVREEGSDAPVDPDTVFQLASFSKPISSTVAAALVGKGILDWESRIADIYPAFQLSRAYPSEQVTVRDLFAHRSGLPGNAGNELEDLGYDRDEILHRLRQVAPASSFRSAYSYSNFGITAGAVAAAHAAGATFEDAAETYLFGPLGMTSTGARHADFLKHDNRAELHVRHQDRWQMLAKRQPDAQAPAGGISSSARDLSRWLRLQLADGSFEGDELIPAEALEATHQPVIYRGHGPFGGQSFYGLGWNVELGRRGEVLGHAGAFSTGARTLVSMIPAERTGIVVLSNAFPTGVPEAVAETFFDLVADGEPSRDWAETWNALYESLFAPAIAAAQAAYGTPPAAPSPALALESYAGTYANDYFGDAVIATDGDRLELRLGPDGARTFPLVHFDRDLFLQHPAEEMPDLLSAVTFRIGPDGRASHVTIESLDDLGMGTFARRED